MRWPQRKWTFIWGLVRSLTLCRWGRRGVHILLCQGRSALEVIWEGNGEGRFCRWVEGVGHLHLLHPPSAHTWDRLCAGLAFICTSEFPSGSVFLSPRRPQMSPNTSPLELRRIEVQAKCNGST